MVHSCKRSGQEFSFKCHLSNHLNKKKICDPVLQDISVEHLVRELDTPDDECAFHCDFCKKSFKSRQGKFYHQKHCPAKGTVEILKTEIEQIKTQQHESMETLIRVLQNISTQMSTMQSRKLRQNINNGTVMNGNNNINVNIQLRDFGNENMAAIPAHLLTSCLIQLDFADLLQNLHFDPDYPENRNIRIKNVKRRLLEVYRNSKWNVTNMDDGIKQMLNKAARMFMKFMNENKDALLQEEVNEEEYGEIKDQIQEIIDKIDEENHANDVKMKRIVKNIENKAETTML